MSETAVASNTNEQKEESANVVDVSKAYELIAQGKRNLLCGEIPDAVNQFQEATKILAEKYGETAKECGDAYLCYGKALLDFSRMESGVLGNALQGIEEEEEEESKSESSDDKVEDGEKVTDDDGTGAESEELNTEEEESSPEGEAGTSKEGDENKDAEDDVSSLQVAWEVLELAKNIFKKEEDKEVKLKLAESHLKLGEVSLETEQYESAIGDFQECLKVQKSVLGADDRCIAETHYQLGVAHTFAAQYEESITNLKEAVNVMETRIKALEKVIEEGEKEGKGKDIADSEDPVYKANKEIKELKDILPDMIAKIDDVVEEQKNAEETKKMVKEAVGAAAEKLAAAISDASEAGEGSSKSEDKPANVITHLVRKKRKTEAEGDEAKTEEPKKAKLENGSGDAPVNGTNGTKESPEKKEAMETEEVKTKSVEDVKKATEEAQAS